MRGGNRMARRKGRRVLERVVWEATEAAEKLGQAVDDLLECTLREITRQERTRRRARILARGAFLLGTVGPHTAVLRGVGCLKEDWSPYYRLLSWGRVDPERGMLLVGRRVIQEVVKGKWVVLAADDTVIYRQGKRFPGVSWVRGRGTAAFDPGLQQGQRFVGVSVLADLGDSYCRAVPVRFDPAFVKVDEQEQKRLMELYPPRTPAEALLEGLSALAEELKGRKVLLVLDGRYDTKKFWRGVPSNVYPAVRTSHRRKLYWWLPEEQRRGKGRGRPRKRGERLPALRGLLRTKGGWQRLKFKVRGRKVRPLVKVVGPVSIEGTDDPMFLLIIRGWSRKGRRKGRAPSYFLVRAKMGPNGPELPMALKKLVYWLWQRWEVEVMHREVKTGFGLRQVRFWSDVGSVRALQWGMYLYSVLIASALLAWGQAYIGDRPERWCPRGKRWTLSLLLAHWREWALGPARFIVLGDHFGEGQTKNTPPDDLLNNTLLSSTTK